MMTDAEIEEIEKLEQSATPGPWKWSQCYEIGSKVFWAIESPQSKAEGKIINTRLILRHWYKNDGISGELFDSDPDLQFIAHAREDIPTLIKEVRRLKAVVAEYADRDNWIESDDFRPDDRWAFVDEPGYTRAANALNGGE